MKTASPDRETSASCLVGALRDGDRAAIEPLVLKLSGDERLRSTPLGALMPELCEVKVSVLEDGLSTRTVNVLVRAGMASFAELAAQSPASLLRLPNLGLGSLREILTAAVREWAGAVLGAPENAQAWRPTPAPVRSVEFGDDLAAAFRAMEGGTPDFDLFRRHALAAERPSLRQLGAELGVTGERVRQRESRARGAIARRMRVEGWPVRVAVSYLRVRIGSLARTEELEEILIELDPAGRAFEPAPHRRALLLLLAGYKTSAEWVRSAGLDSQTDKMLMARTEAGPVRLEDCRGELSRLGVREELSRPWLTSRPCFRIVGDHVARESQVMEIPLAILRAARKPLDLHQLFDRTEPPMCFESFRSHVQQDGRFARRGVRLYGLAEWEEDPYTTLAEEMAKEIKRGGGAVALDALVEVMTERFDVAAGSVLHRARAPQFRLDSAGMVSRRTAPRVAPPMPLALSHNCFHLEAGWAMKVKVTPSLRHGATARMPLAFAGALGLQLGTSQMITCPNGALHAYWPRYAASAARLSGLSSVADELGADDGDRLFVIHSGRDRLDLKLIDGGRCEAATGMARLALECGFEPDREPVRLVLAALGLDPNLADARRVIRTRLRERHEPRLSALAGAGDRGGSPDGRKRVG